MTKHELKELEDRLWQAADNLRANSGLKASQYSAPLLGLVFLRFASIKYKKHQDEIEAEFKKYKGTRNEKTIESISQSICGYYLPEKSRFDYLLNLNTKKDIPQAIKTAMEEIEKYKPELEGSLPKDEYLELKSEKEVDFGLAKELLQIINGIPEEADGDIFGKVYEYFLAKFALAEGQGGGQFFTPASVVQLMVEMIEPYGGHILDPACGSGGMFVQSSDFVEKMRLHHQNEDAEPLQIFGCEKDRETVKIARMNMFLHGLNNNIENANSYYEDKFESFEKFDFVMANPPFNVDDVNLSRVKDQKRFNKYGIPQNKTKKSSSKGDRKNKETVPNANYLWINLFATSLNEKGRAALVMANSASDARNSEADIRQRLIEDGIINCMLSLPKNMFYTVTLPATLWFFDRARCDDKRILFIDARNIFHQVDRAHREFTPEQIKNISCIRHLYYGNTQYMTDLLGEYSLKIETFTAEALVLETARNQKQKARDVLVTKLEKLTDKASNEGLIPSKQTEKELKQADKDLKDAEKEYAEADGLWNEKVSEVRYFESNHQWLNDRFPEKKYEDVTGLCKVATLDEIAEQDYSLNPGRYVGVVIEEDGLTEQEFRTEMEQRHTALNKLNLRARELEELIEQNFKNIWE